MITVIAVFACVGVFFIVMGRWLMAREIEELPLKWKFALGVLPLGDLACLAGPWKYGRAGAIMSLLGTALLLPVGGQLLMDASQPNPGRRSELATLFTSGRGVVQAREAAAAQERLLAHKEIKVKELSRLLDEWYSSLQARRPGFEGRETGDVDVFNAEAAAYHALLAVGKEELAQLETLKAAKGSK